MNNKFKFILRTPEAEIINKEVDSVHLTTEMGEMTLYPHHASLSGAISYSSVIVTEGDKKEEYLTSRGVIFFSNVKNEAHLLAYRSDLKDKVDYDALKDYLKLIQNYIETGKDLSKIHLSFLKDEKIALIQTIEAKEK